jgi:hypothetical protein
LEQIEEFHHGDCVGSDQEASERIDYVVNKALSLGCKIVGHPPDKDDLRAFVRCDELRERKPYLDRNRDIVNESDILIATPATLWEMQRSGTWATVRYARRVDKPVVVLPPLDKEEVLAHLPKEVGP